ncbi:MAG TPA: aldose epimerase family protein [Candidatus Baltobacteraceae bacterium]|jgi:aldose 1-epimerase|nr:aldose epimerase family protein [Candidatus Baltobacteraceae bacterium]
MQLSNALSPAITVAPFGTLPDGAPASIYSLRNAHGIEARVCNYGGILVSLQAPDRHGHLADIVLGHDHLQGYLDSSPYFGALIGRCANRIARGKFTLDGTTYSVAVNNGPNSLHGGLKGFDKALWQPTPVRGASGPALELDYASKDGEEGYPGNLNVKAVYSLDENDSLRVDITASTDRTTIVNLTQHSYFNLAGHGNILAHKLQIDADRFTPVDDTLIPTGELRPVNGTPFDFRRPTAIGDRIDQDDEQLKLGHGYDHNFVVNNPPGRLGRIARATEPSSGRVLEVFSDWPGAQFYTANFLDGTIRGKGGQVYQRRAAFCIEPQHFPDSPNHPHFPSPILKPGQKYRHSVIYKLSTLPPGHE